MRINFTLSAAAVAATLFTNIIYAGEPPKTNLPKGNTITTGQPGGVVSTSTVYPVVKAGKVSIGPSTSSTETGKRGTTGFSSSKSAGVGATVKW